MQMNAKWIVTIALAALLAPAPWTLGADAYTNVTEALLALAASPESPWQAIEYLAKYPDESVPRLMTMVTNQDKGWVYGSAALVRSKDERVVPFYIDLLRNNYYAKETDGTRKQYGLGTKNGCEVMPHIFGGVLARGLGELGDSRAIPTLKEAAKQGDSEVCQNAYEALYKLGALTLDDLFAMAKKNADPQASIPNIIQGIGWSSIHSDTHFALKVFDRVIAELSEHEYEMASAHFWKVQCFTILKQYDQAMLECDEVMKFPKHENLIGQIKAKREEIKRLSDENTEQERTRHNQVPEDTARKLADPQH